jgi:gamma-glutamylcyclotransferase (GGCT)/AIG2-like uncharacterized protein YtfP
MGQSLPFSLANCRAGVKTRGTRRRQPAGGGRYIKSTTPCKPAVNPHLMQVGPLAIFVYGTLQRGQVRERCWPRPALRVEPATVRGWLFDLGPYPALVVPAAGEVADTIAGELWHVAADDLEVTLAALDRIEGFQGNATTCIDGWRSFAQPRTTKCQLGLTSTLGRLGPTIRGAMLPHDEQTCRWPEQSMGHSHPRATFPRRHPRLLQPHIGNRPANDTACPQLLGAPLAASSSASEVRAI